MRSIQAQYDFLASSNAKESVVIIEALDRQLDQHHCRFGSRVIPCFIKPYFLSESETRDLQKSAHIITGMLEKIVQAYFKHLEIQSIFGLSEEEKEYVEMDPGYEKSVVISRPDGFLVNGRMQFIEFNCDSPAGSGYSDVQEKIIRKTPFMKKLRNTFSWGRIHRLESLLNALLDCWSEFGSRKRPNIAIVDWKEVRTFDEFVITRDYFQSQGCPTVIVDPRELKLKKGKLYSGSFQVDLVYRRVIFKELWQKRKEVQDFLKAYRMGKVCVVNPFRSKLAANKSVLSILTNPVYDYLFTKKELAVRDKHIPWTRRVIDAEKFYGGKKHLLTELIEDHQQNLVLKPAEGYGGRDVQIGKECSKKEWHKTLQRALKGGERWVVQEFVPIPEMTVPVLEKKRARLKSKKVNLNPFVFGGRYAGSMARLSEASVINVSAGGGLIPAVKYKKRQ